MAVTLSKLAPKKKLVLHQQKKIVQLVAATFNNKNILLQVLLAKAGTQRVTVNSVLAESVRSLRFVISVAEPELQGAAYFNRSRSRNEMRLRLRRLRLLQWN
jgi:hypothetical protein